MVKIGTSKCCALHHCSVPKAPLVTYLPSFTKVSEVSPHTRCSMTLRETQLLETSQRTTLTVPSGSNCMHAKQVSVLLTLGSTAKHLSCRLYLTAHLNMARFSILCFPLWYAQSMLSMLSTLFLARTHHWHWATDTLQTQQITRTISSMNGI